MNHNKFIFSSISKMLGDAVTATSGVGFGIETYPICDYVMQSIFLKMTGALEQKMKCISWEMAANDYEYRYFRYSQKPLGECSSYKEKKEIYKDLVEQISKFKNEAFDLHSINKANILNESSMQVRNSFEGSNLMVWAQKGFNEYQEIWSAVSERYFIHDKSNLFTNRNNLSNIIGVKKSLDEMYTDHLYKHRNRVAHNTFSYQQNLPTLNTLIGGGYIYDNYFVYFSILVLIDNIFIKLYEEYLCSLEEF
ncbi:hypothetical protein ACFOSD_06745 [Salinispirillum marinum]|uniref:RiboL-PSP-HEPN domain-containing protein n=2 Tax=Saccharospirillaceae TaxID=255527 RepID=A0ABV8BF98_9GAMM